MGLWLPRGRDGARQGRGRSGAKRKGNKVKMGNCRFAGSTRRAHHERFECLRQVSLAKNCTKRGSYGTFVPRNGPERRTLGGKSLRGAGAALEIPC